MSLDKVITKQYSKKIAQAVRAEFSGNVYYFTLSRHSDWSGGSTIDPAYNTTEAINNFQREIMIGKRVKQSDVASLIKRYFWTSGEVYAQYDDTDADLYDKKFYVVNSNEQVFKCLFNNGGAPSTVEPTTVSINNFKTADGYIWKYMYTISSANNTKFSTGVFVPVDSNTTVQAAASNGSIDVILISNTGANYRGFISGSIAETISNTIFRVESDSILPTENFYYNSSSFYITDGAGEGQLTTVSSYIVNSSGHFVITEDPLNNPTLDVSSTFRVAPQIKIEGDGTGAKAVCTVNTISGSYFIETIDILDSGQNYSFANVSVIANPLYGANAQLRAVIPPPGGHGSDPATELGSQNLGVSIFFSNNEAGTISTDIEFRQSSIISSPKKYSIPTTSVTFNSSTNVSNTNSTILITNANTYFMVGDYIRYEVLAGNTALSGLVSNNYYYVVTSNTTAIKLSETYEGNAISLVSGANETGHKLYLTNMYYANTFNGLTRLNIGSTSGNYAVNEYVLGTTSGARAKIAFTNSSVIDVTYVVGTFSTSELILGEDSQTTSVLSSINNPDIAPFSGSVLYLNNIEPIARSNTEFEQAYMILTV